MMNDAMAEAPPYNYAILNEAYPLRLWFSVAAALAGSLQFGYGYGVLNTALCEVTKSLYDDDVNHDAWVNSAVVVGSAIGAMVAGIFADHVGPRRAQIYNVAAFLLGAALTSANFGSGGRVAIFMIGRVLTGFGAGACSLYAPRYIAEIAPLELRGRLVAQCQVFVNLGILVSYCVGLPYDYDVKWVVLFHHNVEWWQVMTALAVVPAVLQLLLLLGCPESPMWLESRDKELADEACIQLWGSRAILYEAIPGDTEHCLIGRAGGSMAAALLASPPPYDAKDPTTPPVLVELKPSPSGGAEGWRALWRHEYRWMLALALGLPVLQQACGVNTVIMYSSELFGDNAVKGAILMGSVNLAFTALAASLMDRWGRRPLLLLSYSGMAACLFAVSVIYYTFTTAGAAPPPPPPLDGGDQLNMVALATTALLILYVLFFAMGAGPVTSLYLSEILPKRIKGKAAALASSVGWVGNLTVALSFPRMLHGALALGGTYLIYGLFNVLALVYLFVLMPETKRRSMREIEALLLLPPRPKLRNMMRGAASLSSPLLGSGSSFARVSAERAASGGGSGGGEALPWPLLKGGSGVVNGGGNYTTNGAGQHAALNGGGGGGGAGGGNHLNGAFAAAPPPLPAAGPAALP